jgi:hypothetical protein
VVRELKDKTFGDRRAAAQLALKEGRAEVGVARKAVEEARASFAEASALSSADNLDRDAIREALLAERVEQIVVEKAEKALARAEDRLAELEAEADRVIRQEAYGWATKCLAEAEAAFRDKYAPSLAAVLDALAIAAAAERAVGAANRSLPEGAEAFSLPFGFDGETLPRFLHVEALDGRGRTVWTGDQHSRPAA